MRKGEASARLVPRSTGGETPGVEAAVYANNRLEYVFYLDRAARRHWLRILLDIELSDRAGE